jgi:hypothetical protein
VSYDVAPFIEENDGGELTIRNRAATEGDILDTGKIVAELKREIERLRTAVTALEGQSPKALVKRNAPPHRASANKGKRDNLTPAGRKRLSELMKKRWAERKKKPAKKG